MAVVYFDVVKNMLSFWAKAIGFHLLKTFRVESSCWAPATTKRLNLTFFLCRSVQGNIKKTREDVCAGHVLAWQDLLYERTMRLMFAYVENMWKRSNISRQRNTNHDEGASATERY